MRRRPLVKDDAAGGSSGAKRSSSRSRSRPRSRSRSRARVLKKKQQQPPSTPENPKQEQPPPRVLTPKFKPARCVAVASEQEDGEAKHAAPAPAAAIALDPSSSSSSSSPAPSRSYARNIGLLKLSSFTEGLRFFLPIYPLILEHKLSGSMTWVATIFSLYETANILLEIPSGAIADLFGRKRTLLLAAGGSCCALLSLLLSWYVHWLFLVPHVLCDAVAQSMLSGTDQALLYDTIAADAEAQAHAQAQQAAAQAAAEADATSSTSSISSGEKTATKKPAAAAPVDAGKQFKQQQSSMSMMFHVGSVVSGLVTLALVYHASASSSSSSTSASASASAVTPALASSALEFGEAAAASAAMSASAATAAAAPLMWASLVPAAVRVLVCLRICEPPYDAKAHGNVALQMLEAARTILRNKQLVLLFLANMLYYGIGQTTHKLYAAFHAAQGIAPHLYGLLLVVDQAACSVGYALSPRLSSLFAGAAGAGAAGAGAAGAGSAGGGGKPSSSSSGGGGGGNSVAVLVFCALVFPVVFFLATGLTGLLSGVALALTTVVWGLRAPVMQYLINLEAPSNERSTIISINHVARSLGCLMFLPPFGAALDCVGPVRAMRVGALLGTAVLFIHALLQEKSHPQQQHASKQRQQQQPQEQQDTNNISNGGAEQVTAERKHPLQGRVRQLLIVWPLCMAVALWWTLTH